MAQFFFNPNDWNVGDNPATPGFPFAVQRGSFSTVEIRNDGTGNYLHVAVGTSGRNILAFTQSGLASSQEVYVFWRLSGSNADRFGVRARGDDGGFYYQARDGAVDTIIDGSLSVIASGPDLPQYVRMAASGVSPTTVKVKGWDLNATEPATFATEVSDSSSSLQFDGYAALTPFSNSLDVYEFGVGTNGDPAPTEPVGGDTTVSPPTATSTSTTASPAVAAGASVATTATNSTSHALSPIAATGASVAPTAVQSTSAASDPAVSSGASASPTVSMSTSNALDPQVTTDQSVLVEPTVSESVSVSPDPLVSTGAAIKPTAAESVSAANDPVIGIAVVVGPTAAESVSAPLTPTVTSGASASPATVYSQSAANDPVVSTAANVFPITARSTGKSLDPLVSGGLDRYVVKRTINGVYYRNVSLRGEYPRSAEIQGIFPRRLTLRS